MVKNGVVQLMMTSVFANDQVLMAEVAKDLRIMIVFTDFCQTRGLKVNVA